MPNDFRFGVGASSPSDVWVVGRDGSNGTAAAGHWNGRAWHAAHPRSPGSSNTSLLAVSADAPDDVWAIGYHQATARSVRLIEHFDGTRWVRVRR